MLAIIENIGRGLTVTRGFYDNERDARAAMRLILRAEPAAVLAIRGRV
jgi:hypothetical protein